jgi:hypothetical protein
VKKAFRNRVRKSEIDMAWTILATGHHPESGVAPDGQGIQNWLSSWNQRDASIGRHKTQLEAIGNLLNESLEQLRLLIKALDPDTEMEEFYGLCRDYDEAMVWLRRIWEYFREKLDQRLPDRASGSVLRAADEVVWSCYRQVFTKAVLRDPLVKQGAAPLAFVTPEYSPAALLADRPPSSLLRPPDASFLTGFVNDLPIPLLQLPPWCIDSPWWLVYIGHEVGHHVQNHLGLERSFALGIRDAADDAAPSGQKLSATELDQWQRWSKEIFADIFSTMMMGPWALVAIFEAELGPAAEMVKPKRDYPAPVIRLALMNETARLLAQDLGEEWRDSLDGLDVNKLALSNDRTKRDLAVVPKAIKFGLGDLGAVGKLQDLCGLAKGIYPIAGKVERWGQVLLDPNTTRKESELESARQVAAGSLSAWASFAVTGDAPACKLQALAGRTVDTLIRSSQPGSRARYAPSGAIPGRGSELVNMILTAARSVRDLDAGVD